MAVCGCLMGFTSFILMFISMGKMLGFRDDFDAVMDQLEARNYEVMTVKHEDFRGLVNVIIDKDVFYKGDALWTEDYSGTLNWLSGKYVDSGADPSPESFKKSRRKFMIIAAINLAVSSLMLLCFQLTPKNANGDSDSGNSPANSVYGFILKGLVYLCQLEIMMPYTVAQKHRGELILFYVPETMMILHTILYFLVMGIAISALVSQDKHFGGVAGCCCLAFLFVAGIPMYAVSYDYLPDYVNTMHSDYSEEMLFNTEYYDKSWLVQEFMLAGLGLDLAALVLDVCVDTVLDVGGK